MGDRTAKKRGGEAKWENEKIYNSKMREGRKSSQQGRGLWWEASGEANDTQETRGPGRGDRHMAKETVNNARSSKALWVKVEEDAVLAVLNGYLSPLRRHICPILQTLSRPLTNDCHNHD